MSKKAWHLIGKEEAVRLRVPFAVTIGKESIAIFLYEGRIYALSNVRNHKAGPLAEGTLDGEYVTCPWQGWVYNIKTGKGEPGYEEDAVPLWDYQRDEESGVSIERAGRKANAAVLHEYEKIMEADRTLSSR